MNILESFVLEIQKFYPTHVTIPQTYNTINLILHCII